MQTSRTIVEYPRVARGVIFFIASTLVMGYTIDHLYPLFAGGGLQSETRHGGSDEVTAPPHT